MEHLEPRLTPGLICYRIEVKLEDRWYHWGNSPTPTTTDALNDGKTEFRAEPVWAAAHKPHM